MLKPTSFSPDPKDTAEGYVLEITFDKHTNKPLYLTNCDYIYDIYPIIDEHSNLAWDFFQGRFEGNVKGDKDYSFGNNGRTLQVATTKLKELCILSNDTPQDVNKLAMGHDGFSYIGNHFPQRIRYYLVPLDKAPDPNKSFLIYCHYEAKWGKILSWAKVVPLKMVNN